MANNEGVGCHVKEQLRGVKNDAAGTAKTEKKRNKALNSGSH
jgi:hypothetical protein